MEIVKTQAESVCVLSLTGRMDTVTSPRVLTALTEAISASEAVELDFARVDYISSAGLRVLLMGEKTSKAAGKAMKLKNVSRELSYVFDITGFNGILSIE